MFTGITTDLGRVRSPARDADPRLEVMTCYNTETIALGSSISCSGVCLSVVEKGADWIGFDVSSETLERTTVAEWQVGGLVNLEGALRIGDELGGHLVSGHVDGVGEIRERVAEGEAARMVVAAPENLTQFIAEKGSVALDGVSLTVGKVRGRDFDVMLIPHTLRCTSFGEKQAGDRVNIEADMIARYVARLMSGAQS